ncbi:alpha-hydroxy acid oxidase [Bryobacter aggregatus]|uniref:alpha-hydroxy acid oxidase n=1 Tax=Bryobacter aggregatus TaxID=360054 RepID=UPI0004E1C08A|nr:alpha-hydroxy acid oxidase [Bryobacter aggregatus]
MTQALFRREFLRFLAASPLLSQSLESPLAALNVMDFEEKAKQTIPPAHFGYLSTGVDDDRTLRANRSGFDRLYLRPRRMVDVSQIDTSIQLFGESWKTPILLAPAGSQKAYHPEGEIAVARAAHAAGHLQILSTMTSSPIEDVAKEHTRKIWYQLYPTSKWEVTEKLVRHAEQVGAPVLVVTVDTQGGRNTETEARYRLHDARPCNSCHPMSNGKSTLRPKPMFQGIDMSDVTLHNPAQTWSQIERYRKLTKMKLLIKGLETGEDARLAVEHGVDGIIVSNHGARAAESGRGTIDALPEVVDAVNRRVPVLIDGGFRRGTDIFKALALGATAVCIGRPYLWALGAFGEAGVSRCLEILRAEFHLAMRQCGTPKIDAINKSYVGRV